MSNLITEIENAFLNTLLPLRYDRQGGYLRMLDSYGGDIKSLESNLIALFPFCLVKYKRAEYKQLGSGVYEAEMEWSIVVGDNTYSGEKARRQGNAALITNPGTYKILEDVKNLLKGAVIYENTKPLELIDEQIITSDDKTCICTQSWKISFYE